jgi:hypothetical protein
MPKGGKLLKIVNIEYIGYKPTLNLHLSKNNDRYMLDNYVPTHNCVDTLSDLVDTLLNVNTARIRTTKTTATAIKGY